MTLRVNVFKPLFGLSPDDLSRLWEMRSGQAGPSGYLTLGLDADGLKIRAARAELDGSENNQGFLIDKRKCTGDSDDRGVLVKRCLLVPSNGGIVFWYSTNGEKGEICGSVNTSTGDVSGCHRALFTSRSRIDLPDTEVLPHLPEIEDMIGLFNSHLSG